VLIVVSSFVAPPLWDAPGTNATGAQTAAYVFDHRSRSVVSLFMFAIAVGIWLPFSAGLWSWMRAREPEPRALSAVFAFAAVAMLVMIVSAFVLKTKCLPRWTAVVAVPAALAHVFIAMSFLSHGALLSVEGSVIVWVPALLFAWLLAVSCAVLRASVTLRTSDW
jgi:hypothetical protein